MRKLTLAQLERHLRDELHNNVGDGLNQALAALEEENTGLDGVLHHIDFR